MTINIIDNEKEPVTLNDIYNRWYTIKTKYFYALVLLRSGSNYYSFEKDADLIDSILQREPLPLWKERQMCQLPFYQIDELLHKAVRAGHRVAVCEPLSSPLQW